MVLEIVDLSASYAAMQALRSVTLEVGSGEIVGVLGPNGAGKSTLLRAVAGLHQGVADGRVVLNGRSILGMPAWRIARLGVALCPQGRRCFGQLTVEENMRMGGYALRKLELSQQMDVVVDVFPMLGNKRRMLACNLSGGEQQMVAIGRALMASPALLLLDEPTLGLAPQIVYDIEEALMKIRTVQRVGIVLVEQHVGLAEAVCDRAYLLSRGSCVMQGPWAIVKPAIVRETLGV